jgi:hypothetical protein
MKNDIVKWGSGVLVAVVWMLSGAPRPDTAVAARDVWGSMASARAVVSPGEARDMLRAAARLNTGEARGWTTQASFSPQTCCNTWKGFNFTGVLSLSPTNSSGNILCVNCVPGLNANNVGMNFPQGTAFVGNLWSTTMTFHSTIPGACKVGFLWVNLATRQPIAGLVSDIADCGGNNVWAWEFYNFAVPNVPGDTVAVGVIAASNGVTDVDFEQFRIQ